MDSPFEPAFASAGYDLPEQFRAEFLVGPDSPFRVTLEGSMEIWQRHRLLGPVYRLLGRAGVLLGATGTDIPTTVAIEPGRDARGAPYHILRRIFGFATPVRFDTLTTYDAARRCLLDHTGPGGCLLLFWQARYTLASPAGATGEFARDTPAELNLVALGFALALGSHVVPLPRRLWPLLMGVPRFSQRALSDPPGGIFVDFAIGHPLLGDLFGYRGTFRVVRVPP